MLSKRSVQVHISAVTTEKSTKNVPGPKGNSKLCLRLRGNKTHCFLRDQPLSVFVIPPNSKIEKKTAKKLFA